MGVDFIPLICVKPYSSTYSNLVFVVNLKATSSKTKDHDGVCKSDPP